MMLYQCICSTTRYMLDQFRVHLLEDHGLKLDIGSAECKRFLKSRKLKTGITFDADANLYNQASTERIKYILSEMVSQGITEDNADAGKGLESVPVDSSYDENLGHSPDLDVLNDMTSSLNEFMMAKAQQYHDYFTQLESKKKEHMDVMESLASELSNFKRYVNTYEHQFQILKLQNDNQLREANTKISQLKCSKTKLQEEVVQLSHEKQSLTLQCDHLSRSVEEKKVELQEAEDRKKSIVDFIYRNIPNLIKDQ